ncbi:MAG: helitron helicase-like domain-containing protein, partial [Anaerorhabdus sp.]
MNSAAAASEPSEAPQRNRRVHLPAAHISQLHRLKPLDLGRMDQICQHCGAKHWKDEIAASSTKSNPFYNTCCKAGSAKLEPLNEPPEFLKALYTDLSPVAKHFRENIRRYNAAFAFTSLNCNVVRPDGMGNFPFQIQGQMYHTQGPLVANGATTPRYAQLYIYDPEIASAARLTNNSDLNPNLIKDLTVILHGSNPYVSIYKHAHQLLQESESSSSNNNANNDTYFRIGSDLKLELIEGSDRRTENLPTTNEVAAIIPINEYALDNFRDIRIYLRNTESNHNYKSINQNHALYMPLHYTLLFPTGDLGWHWGRQLTNGDRLTQRVFYRYRLHERDSEFPIIFYAQRLFQQYVVDSWAICDQNKLDWFRLHQSEIRSDLYSGVQDALIGDDVDVSALGRRFVLPSSYHGGARFMARQYHDSMAIVRYYGKPAYFITFTANPRWKEIERELKPGQSASDRPDLVARVFDLKVKELLNDLRYKNIFGPYKGLVRTIEYQKRGLPHLHLLLFLD